MSIEQEESDLSDIVSWMTEKHKGQFRKGGNGGISLPYIVHPIQVMMKVYGWGFKSVDILKAAVAHDGREDAGITYEEMVEKLGNKAADIVEELTFIPLDLPNKSKAEQKFDYIASFKDKSFKAIIIKVADRLCNVADFFNDDQEKYAAKYFHKADILFDLILSHSQKADLHVIVKDIDLMREKLSYWDEK